MRDISTHLFLCFIALVGSISAEFCETGHPGHWAEESDRNTKVILYWTHFYGKYDFNFGFGREPFINAGCKVNNCRTTRDRGELHQADAVVFHMRNVNGQTQLPASRTPNQNYVFYLQEHPHHQWNDLSNWGGFFNLTMTYRLDSDIPLLYGRTAALGKHELTNVYHSSNIQEQNTRQLVAWFASNCNSHSKREQYVKELQKYIPVDIYGKCGTLRCPDNDVPEAHHRMHPSCYRMLEEKYMFYLSFENIHCKDYVTEKMYNIMELDTVPIVMGGVNYTDFAPPKSYINVADFKSPKQLAEYLLHLSKTPGEYWSYKDWRRTHKVHKVDDTWKEGFCHLCEVLNDSRYPSNIYQDLHAWWGKDTDCDRDRFQKMKASWT